MRLKLLICVCMAIAMGAVTHALAAPLFTPFLSVDINGANYGGGQTVGPTAAGFQPWSTFEGFDQFDSNYNPAEDWGNNGGAPNGLSKTFATSEGNINAKLVGVGLNRGAGNRGANSDVGSDLTSDFAFAARDATIAFGRNYVKLTLSGLLPNKNYEITTWARDHFNGGTDSFEAWSDIGAIGADGPTPGWTPMLVLVRLISRTGGRHNPIPTKTRSPVSGPAGVDLYSYAATFVSGSDASGVVTIYGWADPNTFSGVQGAALLNGFQVAIYVPEPASFGLFGLGLIGLITAGRRRSG